MIKYSLFSILFFCLFTSAQLQAQVSGPPLIPASDQRIEGKPLLLIHPGINDRIRLTRTYEVPVFDKAPQSGELFHADTTDDFRYFPFALNFPATVSISLRLDGDDQLVPLAHTESLKPGIYFFSLTYEDVFEQLKKNSSFELILQVKHTESTVNVSEQASWQGSIDSNYRGTMLGTIIQHDVEIFSGRVSLRREDITLESLGPGLNFIRSYNGHQREDNRFSVLGQGWSHNHRIALHFISFANSTAMNNLPQWVEASRKKINLFSQLPEKYETPVYLEIENGGLFQREGDAWQAQRSYHSRLLQGDGQTKLEQPNFLYTSKDGTQYDFAQANLVVYRPSIDFTQLTFLPDDETITDLSIVKLRTYRSPSYAFTKPQALWIKTIADKNGNRLSYEYSETAIGPVPFQVTDASGRTLHFRYVPDLKSQPKASSNAPLRLTEVTGPADLKLEFKYDTEHYNQIKFKRENFVETYEYMNSANEVHEAQLPAPSILRRYQDGLKHATTFYYYSPSEVAGLAKTMAGLPLSRVVKSVRYPDMNLAKFEYNPEKNQRILTDFAGNKTKYILNRFGNPIEERDPLGNIFKREWSVDLNLPDDMQVTETDSENNTTRYRYDSQGNVTLTQLPNGQEKAALWDLRFSLPLHKRSSTGMEEHFKYDDAGNLLDYASEEVHAHYEYNSLGQKVLEKTENAVKKFEYDQYGYLKTIITNGRVSQKSQYDIRGRLLSIIDAKGKETTYQYDNLDRVLFKKNPDGNTEETRYDRKGNVVFQKTEDGTNLRYAYNERDVVKKIRFNGEYTMYFRYDSLSNIILQVDTNGDIVNHTYNAIDEELPPTQFKPWVLTPLW